MTEGRTIELQAHKAIRLATAVQPLRKPPHFQRKVDNFHGYAGIMTLHPGP
jgi:hypothetical protein